MAEAYVAIGRQDAAKETLLSVVSEATDPWSLINIGTQLSKQGENAAAESLLEKATGQVQHGEDQRKIPVKMLLIAIAYKHVGNPKKQEVLIDGAIKAARQINGHTVIHSGGNEYEEYFEFWDGEQFVGILAENGRLNVIDELVRREGDPIRRVGMLTMVAIALGKNGSVESSRFMQEANSIADKSLRAEALVDVADATEQVVDRKGAARLLKAALGMAVALPSNYVSESRTDHAEIKTELLVDIALSLNRLGETADSKDAAYAAERSSRETSEDPSYYLPKVAKALACLGDVVLAKHTAERADQGGYPCVGPARLESVLQSGCGR